MADDNNRVLTCLGLFVAHLVLGTAASIWNGYVLTWLWAWFVAPVFSLPVLTLIQAVGLAAVVAFLVKKRPGWKTEKKQSNLEDLGDYLVSGGLCPAFTLFVGWTIKICM